MADGKNLKTGHFLADNLDKCELPKKTPLNKV